MGSPVNPLVKLVTRLIVAQAGADAAIGLVYSRRHVPSILITLMLVLAVLALAVVARSGTHVAWLVALGFESTFVMFGVVRFITSRYVGGTLLGMLALGVLLHPAVARAYSGVPERGFAGEPALGEAGADAFGGAAAG
jgi:hypothetical protein